MFNGQSNAQEHKIFARFVLNDTDRTTNSLLSSKIVSKNKKFGSVLKAKTCKENSLLKYYPKHRNCLRVH